MSWVKYLAILASFYIISLLQTSFFFQFAFLGIIPNLLFIFFFLFVFFEEYENFDQGFFSALIAGFFLDLLSNAYFGVSIILLVFLGVLIKKILLGLRETDERHPLEYFLPMFTVCFIAYALSLNVVLKLLGLSDVFIGFDWKSVAELFLNLLIAFAFFNLFKKFYRREKPQLRLF